MKHLVKHLRFPKAAVKTVAKFRQVAGCGQNSHLQPSLVSLKALAAGLVPTQGVLSLIDPVAFRF